jgi:LuxR family maltose regulon positive regulatory protein
MARYLLNDLEQIQETYLLALDDVHLLTDMGIFELLDEWLRHPPRAVHLVLIGRHDPPLQIASLRARNQVTEIRAEDLRFTITETQNFMKRLLDRELDRATAAKWYRWTEGWVTGLRLAVISVRHRGGDNEPLFEFGINNRYLNEYLLAEVLSNVTPNKQACLLKVSILDRFCPSLYEYLCADEQTDDIPIDDGLAFIEWLESVNLFLVPLDDKNEWFRFHHLFQENLQAMLRSQLREDEIYCLYQQAASWCAKSNLLDEALHYALAARDIEAAAELIEQNRYTLMNSEQWNRLERWLKWLPEEVVAQRASLLSTKAIVAFLVGKDFEMLTSAQQAERMLAKLPIHAPEGQIIQAEIAVVQAVMDNIAGRVTESMAKAQSSLLVLPSTPLFIRLLAVATLVVGRQMQGDLQQGMALVRKVLSDPAWPRNLHARIMLFPCIACYQDCDLNGVLEWSQQALQIAEEFELVEFLTVARQYMGVAHYLRNEFTQAEPHLLALLEDREMSAPSYLAMGVIALALIYLNQDRLMEVEQVINLTSTQLREKRGSFALGVMEAFRVELALRRGDLADAYRLSQSVEFDIRPPTWFFYVPQLTAIKLLLFEGTDRSLAEARTRLDVLSEDMHRINRNNIRLDVLALEALVCKAQGDEQTAFEKLRTALGLGIIGGNIRSFVDLGDPMASLLEHMREQPSENIHPEYIDWILAAFPKAQRLQIRTSQSQLDEALTDREFEVLSLLTQRLSNKEIAAQLVISQSTVKSHTLNIYRKLGVNNRTQAVEKALELGILPKERIVFFPR